jgi:hypothetical protein
MRNRWLAAFGVALVVGFLAVEAQARPGGGRGGARGGARPGNIRQGNARPGGQIGQQGIRHPADKLQSLGGGNLAGGKLQNGNFQNKVSQLNTNFTPANQPFTPSWYAGHPGAWQYTHPHADAWAVATFGATAAWLGIAAATDVYTSETTNIYTSDATAPDDASDDEQADVDPANPRRAEGEFLPLGVFALAPKSEKDASALVQLAVNKQGVVRGNYYDILTGQDQAISGTLDKRTQRATFQAGPGGSVTFETTLASLTQPAGSVTLRFAGGQTRQWTLARFDEAAPQAK